ncbi:MULTISPECIES: MarR family winged helix-turn-helix transcriptional regulator [unclassified Kitasatospora]|uniref:MarR family winged helix-turn-helix transcriptional regulator n=1 Tax=unclassified Kitasatospora TaxID=2633591 RepID=UPI00247672D7|nr:MarR family winged helix-turn-helix transcriptional regulator [Kitasatospora sp. MAP12-44]
MPRKRPAPEPVTGWLDEEQQRAWLAYIKVQLRLVYEMNRQLQADSRMSLADWDVLTALGASESASLTVTALAAQIGWERSRLSHHAKRMASRGLVELATADSDRRATEVRLTAEGRVTLERAAPGHVELIKRLFFGGMPRELLDPLSTALESVYANLLAHGSLPPPDNFHADGAAVDAARGAGDGTGAEARPASRS